MIRGQRVRYRRAGLNSAERELSRIGRTGARVDARFDGQEIRAGTLVDALTQRQLRSFRLTGAHISGCVDLSALTLEFPVELRDCIFDEPVVLAEAQVVAVRMPGCHLPSLDATHLRSSGNVELDSGFTVTAGIRLSGARIDGHLSLSHAQQTGSLDADRVQVGQGVLAEKSSVDGELRLVNAQIAGPVVLDHAQLASARGYALNAAYAVVDGQVFLRWLKAHGEIHLMGARVSGDLDLGFAQLDNVGGMALSADSLTVGWSLMAPEVIARGGIDLIGARIGGTLKLLDTTLHRPGEWALLLIESEAMTITLRPSAGSSGAIGLRDARFGRLTDDRLNWPEECDIELTGLTYQRITQRTNDTAPCPIPARLAWMQRHSIAAPSLVANGNPEGRSTFSPAPYEQLAVALQRDGLDREARQVLRFKERRRHRAMGPLGVIWGTLQDITVGFGHRPSLALAWLTGLLATGTTFFAAAGPLPAVKKGEAPTWDPFLYSLDLLVPLVDLGHDKAWDPTGWSKVMALTLIIAGWVLATTVVAGASRVLNRR